MDADGPHYETDELRRYAYEHADDPLDWETVDRMASDIQGHIHSDYNPAPVGSDGRHWHVGDTTEDGQTVIGIGTNVLFVGRYRKSGRWSTPVPVLVCLMDASKTSHADALPPAERMRRIVDRYGKRDTDMGRALLRIADEIEGDEG